MDVNGCRILAVLDADGDDGFKYTVTRYTGCRSFPNPLPDPKNTAQAAMTAVDRGPFLSQLIAVQYALSWSDAGTPPPMPTVVTSKVAVSTSESPSVVVQTTSENAATQVVAPETNPPVANEPTANEAPVAEH